MTKAKRILALAVIAAISMVVATGVAQALTVTTNDSSIVEFTNQAPPADQNRPIQEIPTDNEYSEYISFFQNYYRDWQGITLEEKIELFNADGNLFATDEVAYVSSPYAVNVPEGDYTSLEEAVDTTRPGAIIVLRDGFHPIEWAIHLDRKNIISTRQAVVFLENSKQSSATIYYNGKNTGNYYNVISGPTIVGNPLNTHNEGIRVRNSSNVLLHDIYFLGIKNISYEDTVINLPLRRGLQVENSNNVVIANCAFKDTAVGVKVRQSEVESDVYFNNNAFEDIDSYAMYLIGDSALTVDVMSNAFHNNDRLELITNTQADDEFTLKYRYNGLYPAKSAEDAYKQQDATPKIKHSHGNIVGQNPSFTDIYYNLLPSSPYYYAGKTAGTQEDTNIGPSGGNLLGHIMD